MHLSALLTYLYVYLVHSGAWGFQKKELDPLELVTYGCKLPEMGFENQT